MLTIPAPVPSRVIAAAEVEAAEKAGLMTKYGEGRLPLAVTEALIDEHYKVTSVKVYDLCRLAGTRIRALAVAFGHGWMHDYPNEEWGYICPAIRHETASGTARWTVNPRTGDLVAEVRPRGKSGAEPLIIIEAPARGPMRVHIAGYPAVWTTSGWDQGSSQAKGDWSPLHKKEAYYDLTTPAQYCWAIAQRVIKALGAPSNLPGDGPIPAPPPTPSPRPLSQPGRVARL